MESKESLDENENFKAFKEKAEREFTMILQSLGWDRKHLEEGEDMVTCSIDKNHRVPLSSLSKHEEKCRLKQQGYVRKDKFLPDLLNPDSNTVVKLSASEIAEIIENVSRADPLFKRGVPPGCADERPLPLTAERLQATYTPDERRAIHDAVVARAPVLQEDDISDLTEPGSEKKKTRPKTHLEILAELRNMKRRRTKYKVATKSKNYSEILREVIKNQMELYLEANPSIKEEPTTSSTQYDVRASTSYEFRNQNEIKNKQEKIDHDEDYSGHSPHQKHRNKQRNIHSVMDERENNKASEYDGYSRRKYNDFENSRNNEGKTYQSKDKDRTVRKSRKDHNEHESRDKTSSKDREREVRSSSKHQSNNDDTAYRKRPSHRNDSSHKRYKDHSESSHRKYKDHIDSGHRKYKDDNDGSHRRYKNDNDNNHGRHVDDSSISRYKDNDRYRRYKDDDIMEYVQNRDKDEGIHKREKKNRDSKKRREKSNSRDEHKIRRDNSESVKKERD